MYNYNWIGKPGYVELTRSVLFALVCCFVANNDTGCELNSQTQFFFNYISYLAVSELVIQY